MPFLAHKHYLNHHNKLSWPESCLLPKCLELKPLREWPTKTFSYMLNIYKFIESVEKYKVKKNNEVIL